jgi:predicted ribosome quality control (RQC) complex YloA/Tae2 family protein
MKKETVYFQEINKYIDFTIGKNDKDNFDIIDKANSDDIWFHLNNYPSCHVIASINDIMKKKDLRYIIKKGALLCKENSKYKSEKDLSIIYTTIKNVKKTEKVGSVITTNTKIILV